MTVYTLSEAIHAADSLAGPPKTAGWEMYKDCIRSQCQSTASATARTMLVDNVCPGLEGFTENIAGTTVAATVLNASQSARLLLSVHRPHRYNTWPPTTVW